MSIKYEIFNLLLLLAMLSLSMSVASGNNIRCFDVERQALLDFKDKLVDEYGRLSSWGNEENKRECCKWRGVQCHNRTNHVTRLNLRGSSQFNGFNWYGNTPLNGKISHSLLELKHLTYLDLSFNYFSISSIPEFFGSLNQLHYLNLSYSENSGKIPQSIGNLSKLIYLDLSSNHYYSENLDWVSHLQSVEYLDLSGLFTYDEKTNWLQAISKLSSIKELHWSYANLRDVAHSSLPLFNASTPLSIVDLTGNDYISFSSFRWFLNFNNSLKFIDFSGNNITGPISYAFENLRSLAHLDLSYNGLVGGIPKFFGNMSSLLYLNLQHNILTAQLSNLSGPLEKKLQHLDLSFNMMSGSLIDFSRFSSLTRLALGHNKLNGFVEKGYLNIPYLIALDLSSNNFTGPLSDLTLPPCLKELFLHENMFNGPLRESIGPLSKLEVLCLGSNQLEDVVTEADLFNLSRLQVLELSSNPQLTLNCSPDWIPTFQLTLASLSGCNVGPQFPEWLRFQTKLVFLDISLNQITDKFPKWFADLASQLIHLNVSNNQIHGVFPHVTFPNTINNQQSFALVPEIRFHQSLALVPEIWFGPVLDLSRNRIMGPLFFLCNTGGWRLIDLSDNLFSEQLPECFANFRTSEFFNLANNNFSGKIPHFNLTSLVWLDLRNNSFSGNIPSSMMSCLNLKMLDLGNNRLTGEIPHWLGSEVTALVVLSLRSNDFYGTIPSSMCILEYLQVLDLSSNNITGAIPKCLHFLTAMTRKPTPFTLPYLMSELIHPVIDDAFSVESRLLDGAHIMWKGHEVKYLKVLSLVTLIDLSNNNLVGDIPSEITELISLVGLNLSRNNLTGSIPQYIGRMNSLDFLDLSRNNLSGGIPSGIWELGFLGVMNLSYNNFSGMIPPISHFGDSSYIGNSLLCGRSILNKSCPGDYEPHRGSNFVDDDNVSLDLECEDDSIIIRGFYIFLGLGFIIGFWGTIATIMMNKSITYAFFKMTGDFGDYICVKFLLNKARLQRLSRRI